MAVVFCGYSMYGPLIPLFGLDQGATPALVGALVAVAFLPSLFLAIPFGAFADRLNPLHVLRAGVGGMVLAPALLLLLPGIPTLVIFQVVLGLSQLAVVVGAQTAVALLSSGRRLERDYGWYTTALSVGQAIGPFVAGVTLDALGFRAALVESSLFALLAWVTITWMFAPGTQTSRLPSTRARVGERRLHGIMSNRGVLLAVISSAAILLGMSGVQAFLPVRLGELGTPATTIGLLFTVRAIAAVMVRPFVANISSALGGRSKALLIVVTIAALGLLVVALDESIAVYVTMSVLVGFGSGVSQPLSMAMVIDHVAPEERGLAVGFRLTLNRVAQFIGPLALGWVAAWYGTRSVFVAAGLTMLLVNALAGRVARQVPGQHFRTDS